jgi:hypothetical protein
MKTQNLETEMSEIEKLKKDRKYHLKEMMRKFPGTAFESTLLNSIYAGPLAGIVTATEVALMGHKDLSLPLLFGGVFAGFLGAFFTATYAALNTVGPPGEQDVVSDYDDFARAYRRYKELGKRKNELELGVSRT